MASFDDVISMNSSRSAYLSPCEVGSLYARNKNSLSFIHINAQSVGNKEEQIVALFASLGFTPDVLMITETWFKNDADVFKMPGFNTFFVNRPSRRGGGVMLMAKNTLHCQLIESFSFVTLDYEVLSVKCNNNVYCVLYRPPGTSIPSFLSFMDDYLNWINDNHFKLIMGGDINIDFLKTSKPRGDLYRTLESNGFANLINAPTHVSLNSTTLIDVFITNVEITHLSSGVVSTHISDHLPIFLLLKQTMPLETANPLPLTVRDVNAHSLNNFRNEILLIDWSPLLLITDPETAYDYFHEKFKVAYEKCFRYKVVKPARRSRKPWVTKQCLQEIGIKNRLFHNFISTRSEETLRQFRVQRNKVNSLLRREKKLYLQHLFNVDVTKKSDILWKRINFVLGRDVCKETIKEITIDDNIMSGKDLVEAFNEYFTSLVKSSHDPNCLNFLSSRTSQSAFLAPTTPKEITDAFLSIRNSKCCDIDGFEIGPAKYVLDAITPALTHIYNLVLSDGTFPKALQVAKVIVLHKGGDKNALTNYRPISVLPIFSKALEKLIHSRVTSFITKHKLMTNMQFGFTKGQSTETALLTQKEIILDSFERQLCTLGIFVDYSKAFDCINHTTLIEKFKYYGFRGFFFEIIKIISSAPYAKSSYK